MNFEASMQTINLLLFANVRNVEIHFIDVTEECILLIIYLL